MIIRRRLHVAAITAFCATLAMLGASTGAMASSNTTAATTGQIKACYKTSGSLPPLDHIATTGTCPTGDSSLTWNTIGRQGPPGPAGIATGISTSSFSQVGLNTGANQCFPFLSTSGLPLSKELSDVCEIG